MHALLRRGLVIGLVLGSVHTVAAQSLVRTGPDPESPVEILVGGKVYLRVDKNGNIAAVNNAVFLVQGMTTGVATRIPFYDANGALTSDASLFWDATNGKLNVLGGTSANNGALLVTRKATGGNPVLATAASFYRNSQYNSGTPTSGDKVNAEFLLQADDNLWYAVGGVGGKLTTVTAASVGGGTELYCKPNGAGDTTIPCAYLSQAGKLRVGDSTEPSAPIEVKEVATGFVLSGPSTLTQNETIAVKPTAATATPGNPTGTTSTTDVMMGLNMSFTAKLHGRTRATCSLIMKNSTSGDGAVATLYRGTGSAPTNGAAVTGTQTGGGKSYTAIANNQEIGIVLDALPTLTPGTATWFDIAVHAVTAGTVTISTISCMFMEI